MPLSATYAARDLGILDAELFSTIVLLSLATSIFAPLALLPLRSPGSIAGS